MQPPKPCAMWPLTIAAGVNDKLNVVKGGTYVATIGAGTYYSPASLAAAVAAALTAAVANAWTVTVGVSGRVTVAGSAAFSLLFASGANAATSARDVLGFGAVDTPSAISATGATQMQNAWFPEECVADDTGDLDEHTRSQGLALAGPAKSLHFATRQFRDIQFGMLLPWKLFKAEEGSAHLSEAYQRLLSDGWARFRWFPDATALATGADYFLDLKSAKDLPRDRLSPGAALYALSLRMRKFV